LALALALPRASQAADEPPAAAGKSGATPAETKDSSVEKSVVKIFATVRYPDPYRPWTKQAPSEIVGSGVVIEGRRILSNAHLALYASQVQVQPNQAADKISATIEALAPGIDLAVLKLDDESFFDTHPPLPRTKGLPEIQDSVVAYGYPTGGTSLSITKGVVSRIEFVPYNFPVSGLRIQIDAAINPGNSGGPAVVDGKMIGLAFSHLGGAQNIGYIIPNEEIEIFLADVADGHYDGKPAMFDDCQTLENPALRPYLKLDKSVQGMIVHRPDSFNPSSPLKPWDVITKIGETSVDDQGMIKLGPNLRVYFKYMVQKVAKEGKIPLTLVRAGKEMRVELPVFSQRPTLVPNLDGAYPSYFVYGPLVFSDATGEMIGGAARGNGSSSRLFGMAAMGNPLVTRLGNKPSFEGERLVAVASPFLPHKLAKGYDSPSLQIVKTINGVEIKNLAHLVEVLRDSKDQFITFEFDNNFGEALVFDRAEMVAATEDILTDNGIRQQGSSDALAVWNAKRGK
jgi:S1-C subfamily serine protease